MKFDLSTWNDLEHWKRELDSLPAYLQRTQQRYYKMMDEAIADKEYERLLKRIVYLTNDVKWRESLCKRRIEEITGSKEG